MCLLLLLLLLLYVAMDLGRRERIADDSMPAVTKRLANLLIRYDHLLTSYSVIAADTLRDTVTLTFDLLTLVRGHTWWVT